MGRWITLICLMLAAGCGGESSIAPFSSDGCSDFPNGTPLHRQIWLDCCITHDRAYWRGGTSAERMDADLALQACVTAVGEPAIAKIMLAGVRVGGSPWWPTRYRWGYGWPWPSGYRPLTTEERQQADQMLRSASP